jgi:multimeric flavodoxin WrbA
MKVVAFNGSARKNGNTAILVNYVLHELKKEGIKTELIQLAGKEIRGCTACYKCFENKNQRCAVDNDVVNDRIEKMIVPGSSYWNMGIGRDKGEVETDEEGIQIMKTLAQNMAWLLKKIGE